MTEAESLWGFVPGAVDRYFFFLRYPIGRVYHSAILFLAGQRSSSSNDFLWV